MTSLAQQYDAITMLQNQASTGQQIQHSSEDPLLADKIKSVTNTIQNLEGYQLNNTLAFNRVSLLNSTVMQTTNIIQRVQQLIQSAQTDTLSNSDRLTIAKELSSYADSLLSLGNTQDSNGEYIFSGMNVSVPSFVKQGNNFIYQGGFDPISIAVGPRISIQFNDSGFQVFGNIKTGNGIYTVNADAVNNTGTGIATLINSNNNSSFVSDNYTLSFVTNASGQLAYQVIGDSSGLVVPAPPLASPADAVAYVPDNAIQFNGVSLQISGQPNVGDVFQVTPSVSENIFNSLQTVINTLNNPVNSDKERADLHQQLLAQGATFKQVLDHFREFLTEVGNRGQTVDDQKMMTNQMILDQNTLLGTLSDAHMEDVLPELTQRLTALELTQQSYLKIQETLHSIFTRSR
jgi:flagellar hook-associated protein 3 FlgL